ncbi:MAG: hypothetical protein M1818_005294 [Claussenomyces sp. TS43310]|nr:MAG: hypothetical protein M1818_005294 [Claussenomyces sp. TS43310]
MEIMTDFHKRFKFDGPRTSANVERELRKIAGEADPTSYEVAGIEDVNTWTLSSQNTSPASEGVIFYTAFVKARRTYWRWIRQWLHQSNAADLEGIDARKAKMNLIPDILVPQGLENQSTVFLQSSVQVPISDGLPMEFEDADVVFTDDAANDVYGNNDKANDREEMQREEEADEEIPEQLKAEDALDAYVEAHIEDVDIVLGSAMKHGDCGTDEPLFLITV